MTPARPAAVAVAFALLAGCASAPTSPLTRWTAAAERYREGARTASPTLLMRAARELARDPARPWSLVVTTAAVAGIATAPHAVPAPSPEAAFALAGVAGPPPAPDRTAPGPRRSVFPLVGGGRALIALDDDESEVAVVGDDLALWVFDTGGALLCRAAAAFVLRCRWPVRGGAGGYDVVVRNLGRDRTDVTVLAP